MISFVQRRKRLFLVCTLWGILLGALAVQPDHVVKIFLPTTQARFAAHMAAYGALAFLFCLYWRFKRVVFGIHLKNIHLIVLSFVLTALLGGLTEVLQIFTPDRYAEITDIYFDMMGAGLGIACFFIFRRVL